MCPIYGCRTAEGECQFPLADAKIAHQLLEAGSMKGKIVLAIT